MGEAIHGRRRDGMWRYRVWSSFVDTYITEEMDAEALKARWLDKFSPRDVREGTASRTLADALDRVHTLGTSSRLGDAVDLEGPWAVEMCRQGRFHHAFRLEHARGGGAYKESDNMCGWCGEPRSDHAHEPECTANDAC